MQRLIYPLVLLLSLLPIAVVQAEKEGAYLGAEESEIPDWFKESFLEFEEDVAEARDNNRRIMIYFHQPGCPYCARLVNENFTDPETVDYLQQHFDSISINMWGDREVVNVGGQGFTEKSFSLALKIQYTPTLIFLDEQGKIALRLNGYYSPEKLRQALRYVAEKKENELSFNQFMLKQSDAKSAMISEDFFQQTNDLKAFIQQGGNRPYAIYFEAAGCEDCKLMHDRVLSDEPTRDLAKQMHNTQLDVMSDQMITTPQGEQMSVRDYARQLNIGYTPTVVFFDRNRKEVHRIDGFLKTFHFQSTLDYILEAGYIEQPSFQRYISARGERLRAKGFNTDIWGYDSFHSSEAQK